MKKFAAILGVVATLATTALGKIAFGGCPNIETTVPFNAKMTEQTAVRLHYFDRLPNNLFTLANLLLFKQYQTLDCLGKEGLQDIFTNFFTEARYNEVTDVYLNGKYGFRGGITHYDETTKTWIMSACLDAEGLVWILKQNVIPGDLPKAAEMGISIALYFFKQAHLQLTAVFGEDKQVNEADIITAVNQVPGMQFAYLTSLKQDPNTCPNGSDIPKLGKKETPPPQ